LEDEQIGEYRATVLGLANETSARLKSVRAKIRRYNAFRMHDDAERE
jgi:hypothetical protein